MRFLNRADELHLLRARLDSERAELLVVYGRRRIGKTELLTRASQGCRAMFYEATDTVPTEQLRDLTAHLAAASDNRVLRAQQLTSWEAALAAIAEFVGGERTLVVLDEFQYLAVRSPELESTLSRWWRTVGRELPIVLVLAGSELGFFEDRVLAGQLYGRRTGQLKVEPFWAAEAALFHPTYSPDDRVRTYSVAGGVPYYLERFSDERPLDEALLAEVLDRSGLLHDEAELMLRQSIPDPGSHTAMLRAIVAGRNRVNEIGQWTGLHPGHVTKLLESLLRLGLVTRLRPVTASTRSKRTAYALADQFLQFHFRFVEPAKAQLRTPGMARQYLERAVLPELDHHASSAWEVMCRQHMLRHLPGVTEVGRWWGPVPTGVDRRTEERELDVVAVDANRRPVAFGMCNWTTRPVGMDELRLLRRVAGYVPGRSGEEQEYLFSRSGFTAGVEREAAQRAELHLVRPADLYATLPELATGQ